MDIEFQVKMTGYQYIGMKMELGRVVRRHLGRSSLGNGMAVLAKVLSILLLAYFSLVAVMFLFTALVLRTQPEYHELFEFFPNIMSTVYFISLIILVGIPLSLLVITLNIRKPADPMKENLWPRDAALVTVTFGSEFFQVDDPYLTGRVDYHAVQAVSETARAFYLHLHGEQVLMLRKQEFLQGSPEQFRDYIAAATGLPVEYIKA